MITVTSSELIDFSTTFDSVTVNANDGPQEVSHVITLVNQDDDKSLAFALTETITPDLDSSVCEPTGDVSTQCLYDSLVGCDVYTVIADCEGQAGCSISDGNCDGTYTGTADCSDYNGDLTSCQDEGTCSVSGGSCSGNYQLEHSCYDDYDYGGETSCALEPQCAWVSNMCTGTYYTTEDCSIDFILIDDCLAEASSCDWVGWSCSGSYTGPAPCSDFTDYTSCLVEAPDCDWINWLCSGGFLDEVKITCTSDTITSNAGLTQDVTVKTNVIQDSCPTLIEQSAEITEV